MFIAIAKWWQHVAEKQNIILELNYFKLNMLASTCFTKQITFQADFIWYYTEPLDIRFCGSVDTGV